MNERIRESGGHWWELLNGQGIRFGFEFDAGGRKQYGLISGGKLVAVLLDRCGSYCIGFYLYNPIEEDADCMTHKLIKICKKAKIQTIDGAMQEAETAYLSYLTEQRDYYAGLWRNYTGKPVNADDAPVIYATWNGVEYDGYADGSPVYNVWECSNCGEEHCGEENTLTRFCPHCGAKMDV